jgi:23S rRNA pseudouridine2457 synthase
MMSKIILFNKPYGVLSQFSDTKERETLANFLHIPDIYPAGRLDRDSEGLLLLTDDPKLQHQITHPRYKLEKRYWVQVEGIPDANALCKLQTGVILNDGKTKPASARIMTEPTLWQRNPPIRYRKNIPTTWLEMKISEGRNRQIRRMTAAVGHPTLRLVRFAIGKWQLGDLLPGHWRCVST